MQIAHSFNLCMEAKKVISNKYRTEQWFPKLGKGVGRGKMDKYKGVLR